MNSTRQNDKCSSQIYEINMRSTAMKNSADFILQGYDYTIGKIIEYILHEEYYKKNGNSFYLMSDL